MLRNTRCSYYTIQPFLSQEMTAYKKEGSNPSVQEPVPEPDEEEEEDDLDDEDDD